MRSRKYEIPNSDEVDLARARVALSTRLLQDLSVDDPIKIQIGDQELMVPRLSIELLRDILAGMSAGKSIGIVPVSMEMTTQQQISSMCLALI